MEVSRLRRHPRPWPGILPPIFALALSLLAGCGGAAAPSGSAAPPVKPPAATSASAPAATTAPTPALRHVTLRQAYLLQGYGVPFIAAQAQGFYRRQGFDVAIPQGKGSATTVETVANGSDQFGFADAGTAALLISKGAPVKVLSVYVQINPASFIYHPATTSFDSPAQLRGRPVITAPGNAGFQLFPAVLARYGLKTSDFKVEFVDPAAVSSSFARNPQAFTVGFDTDYPNYLKVAPDAKYVPFAHFGVNPYSIGLITSDAMVRNHPNEVRRFVAASDQGWAWTVQHPKQAVADAIKAFPQASAPAQSASLKIVLASLHTPRTQGHPLGWMDRTDWQDTLALLHKYGGLKTVKPLSDYYTDAFVGGGA